ncbi:MAG: polysaccharide deacetylase family protein, partial [Ignavibacteria bacterium]
DYGDYSTNEPTLDGTASLALYLSFLHNLKINSSNKNRVLDQGGIVRFDTTQKKIYLIFSAHEFGEGLAVIRETLKKNNIKASFFFTGEFLRQRKNHQIIKNLIKDGNLIGPHSNEHLLYCDWNNRDSLLINREEFFEDLRKNLFELQKFGLSITDIKYFLPPFEWYNQKIAHWTQAFSLQLINFTPSTFTNADYTTPDMENYQSSDSIIHKLYKKIQDNPNELSGAILLIHSGTHPSRKDKLYNKLDEVIKKLKSAGYQFDRLN